VAGAISKLSRHPFAKKRRRASTSMTWDPRVYVDRYAKQIVWAHNISCDHPSYPDVLRAAVIILNNRPQISKQTFMTLLTKEIIRIL
jgi:hypothetical protein